MIDFTRTCLIGALACLLLAGCVSSQEIALADDRECVQLGFEPGTEGYGNCRLKLREIRALERQALAVESHTMNPWARYPYWW